MKNQKHNEIALRVGNYLRRQIKQRGLSTSAIAEQLGYSERQIRRWINGQSSRFDTVEQIAFLFDVSVWDVLADEGEDIPSSFKKQTIFYHLLQNR